MDNEKTIFYFSGTGNSLELAKRIQKRLTGYNLVSIVKALKDNNFTCKAKGIGFVFPCHGFTLPIPVKRFLDKFIAVESEYIFAAVTRGGTTFIGFDQINKALSKSYKKLNASFVFDMPGNDPKFEVFKNPGAEELAEYEIKLESGLDKMIPIIKNQIRHHDDKKGKTLVKNKFFESIIEKFVGYAVQNIAPGTKRYFYIDDRCNGCGICEKVCTSGKILMKDGKPEWTKNDCFMCYACINFCPEETIQIHSKYYMKSYTEKTGRYKHPFADMKDIMKQKEGNTDE